MDGLFLHTPAVVTSFDVTIYVRADYEACIRRAVARNQERAADAAEVEALCREKYLSGFRLYCKECDPEHRATLVVDN